MKIKISDNRKISEIQKEFNELFPYLKIEFFSKPHKKGEASEEKYLLNSNLTISKCCNIHKKADIYIIHSQTVADIEEIFKENLGLSIRVSRKSGGVWLQTTATEDWSLQEQNKHGEELSKFRR